MSRISILLAVATVLGGCAASSVESTTSTTVAPPTTTTSTITPPPPTYYEGIAASPLPEDVSVVAMSKGDLAIYSEPDAEEPSSSLPAATILGTVTVVTVIEGPIDGWAKVMLPVRPNGSEGWVKTSDVQLFLVEGRVVVDLSDKSLTYYVRGEEVLNSVVAVGTSRNPTPTGQFFVTDSVTLANPDSAWGPHALGLSGRSDTITEYNGGDGIIGIHGTNRPDSIGNAASLGCVRLPNEIITQLHGLISIGVPVEIQA
ncbi:MAG TPA: L,D-transpeptidase family protein [Acidimicrobiia bacterium]